MAKRGRNPLPVEDFNRIKEFQCRANSVSFTSKQVGWSERVVRRAYKADSYQEYLLTCTKKIKLDADDKEMLDKITEKEAEIEHLNVARRATAICAIMMMCDHWSLENESVSMKMPFHMFVELADHYEGRA